MPSLADLQRDLDREIFEEIGEVLIVDAVEVPGVFYNRPRQVDLTYDGTFVGVELSFDCQYDATVAALSCDDVVRVVARGDEAERALGEFRFRRRLPDRGDESGLVTIELGYL